jgi:hypothetical protein
MDVMLKKIIEILLCFLHPIAVVLIWINLAVRQDIGLGAKLAWGILCIIPLVPFVYVLTGNARWYRHRERAAGAAVGPFARGRPALLRILVRGLEEFSGHDAHGYVTGLQCVGRDGRRIDFDKGGKLWLGPDHLPSLAEPPPDSDHGPRTTLGAQLTRSAAHRYRRIFQAGRGRPGGRRRGRGR